MGQLVSDFIHPEDSTLVTNVLAFETAKRAPTLTNDSNGYFARLGRLDENISNLIKQVATSTMQHSITTNRRGDAESNSNEASISITGKSRSLASFFEENENAEEVKDPDSVWSRAVGSHIEFAELFQTHSLPDDQRTDPGSTTDVEIRRASAAHAAESNETNTVGADREAQSLDPSRSVSDFSEADSALGDVRIPGRLRRIATNHSASDYHDPDAFERAEDNKDNSLRLNGTDHGRIQSWVRFRMACKRGGYVWLEGSYNATPRGVMAICMYSSPYCRKG
eukprot:gb/GECG01005437.1/.p1 GENE.gb/GECG01005437.1/~~gb/GECG01005437.1/.p1  ORF type:complete len:281 (+),score=29.31 gb/GECG01005437.1/:1-843(+)